MTKQKRGQSSNVIKLITRGDKSKYNNLKHIKIKRNQARAEEESTRKRYSKQADRKIRKKVE